MKFYSLRCGIAAAAVVVSCMVPMRVVAQGAGDGIGRAAGPAAEAAIKAAEVKPTPRAADGHPDLNGYWGTPAQAPKSTHVDAQDAVGWKAFSLLGRQVVFLVVHCDPEGA